jgi:Autotransporter beta-domain
MWSRGVLAALVLLAGGFVVSPVLAQSALCPTNFQGQTNIIFSGSSCTNSTAGAYSNAALASQSLGDLTESSSLDATKVFMQSISYRRTTEAGRCPDGSNPVNGRCGGEPVMSPLPFAEPVPGATWMSMPTALEAFEPTNPILAKAPVAAPATRVAVWTQAYGDYERLTGQSPGLGEFSVLGLDVKSTSWTGGVLGGVDFTFRGVAFGGDGLIVGMLAGYESSNLSVSTSSISSASNTPSGFSTMKGVLSGPATGVYASYFEGGFSTDLAFKAEFFNLNLSFNDLLGFAPSAQVVPNNFPPTTVPFAGSGVTSVNNYTTSGDVNYRFPISGTVWTEPTAGVLYIRSDYASDAQQFALADSSVLRLQGGERFGIESTWDTVRMTTVFTGLLFENVAVTGGVLQNAFNPLILSEQGKLCAEGILSLNFYQGNGVSYLLLADLQGGQGLFFVGGKVGVRVAW